MTQKLVTIPDNLLQYITDTSKSLSKYIQNKIIEDIKKECLTKKYNIDAN
ncbi:MAG: hypothetical protein WC934_02080 [Acidithiobacillus sp.]